MQKIIIKIGSLVLTKEDGQLNKQIIKSIVKDVAALAKSGKKIAIISSGAVSGGRADKKLQSKFRVISNGQDKAILREQVLASIGQPRLMSFYARAFERYGLICAQILVTRFDFSDRKRYLSLRQVANNLLSLGIIPIFNENDVLSDEELTFSDNDQLACSIASMLGANKLIMLTNVDGVYDKDPAEKGAKLISEIYDIEEILKNIGPQKSLFGKGGIRSKLQSAQLITSLGIPMQIANGLRKGVLAKILIKKEKLGTVFGVQDKKKKPIKNWIASSSVSTGFIVINACLADILKRKKFASILVAGIERAEGDFEKGDIVAVHDLAGNILGKGQVKYFQNELLEKLESKNNLSKECRADIVIHYDYLVLN